MSKSNIFRLSLSEINNYNYSRAWKKDDPEWIRERKKQWPSIQKKIDQIRVSVTNHEIQKKQYKDIKAYFLTGDYNTLLYSPYAGNYSLLFAFWLSPDHSWEHWHYIKSAYMYTHAQITGKSNDDEKFTHYVMQSSIFLRRLAVCYPGTQPLAKTGDEIWQVKLSPYHGCESIFEDEVMEVFLKELPINDLNEEGIPFYQCGHDDPYWFYEPVLLGYLGGGSANVAEFNPNNSIRYFLDEFLEYRLKTRDYDKESAPQFHYKKEKILYALIWHICINPENSHPLQVEVAQKLQKGILAFKDEVNEVYQAAIDEASAMAEEGIPKSFHTHGLWDTEVEETKSSSISTFLEQSRTFNKENLEYRVWY